jgi:tetratricopeptide (TPR) repeat protein
MSKKRKSAHQKQEPQVKLRSKGIPYSLVALCLLGAVVLAWYCAFVYTRMFYSGVNTFTARQLINTRRAPEAEASAIRSVRLDPDNGYAHYYLGSFYHRQRRFDKAEEELYKALRTIAHPATPLLLLAEINLLTQEYKKGLFYFDRTFKMNPKPRVEPARRWYSYAKAAANAGNYAIAVYAFQESLDLLGSVRDIHQSIGAQLYRLGLPNMAILEFERQILMNPDQPQIYTDIATVIREQGNYKEGIRFFEKIYKAGNTRAGVTRFLGIFYMKAKEYDKAIDILEEHKEKNPSDTSALFLLGMTHYEMGNNDNAQKYMTEFIETSPPEKSRLQAQRILDAINKK